MIAVQISLKPDAWMSIFWYLEEQEQEGLLCPSLKLSYTEDDFKADLESLIREQSYERNLALKKTKLLLHSLKVCYLNLDHGNAITV